jgi:hypothetical protein
MRVGRLVLIPAILALSVTGSTLAGSALSVAVSHSTQIHAQADGAAAAPNLYYHA